MKLGRLSLLSILAAAVTTLAHGQAGGVKTFDLPKTKPASFNGDVRNLPVVPAKGKIQLELQEPQPFKKAPLAKDMQLALPNLALAPMPAPATFAGLSYSDSVTGGQAGAAIPPDTNGDVGPNHYIQAVNSAYAIYSKSTGARLAAFTENSLFSGGPTGTLCDTDSQGDPVVLYDPMADRWILSNFAFTYSGNSPASPFYQCIAVSKSGDPVAGGWWLYAVRTDTGLTGEPPVGTLNDYGKFGIWTDCLYYSANGFNSSGALTGIEVGSFSKADLYSGAALTSSLGWMAGTTYFSMLPSNITGPAGSLPPPGTPNYFVTESLAKFAFVVLKFTPGSNCGGGGSLDAPVDVLQASYADMGKNIVPQPGTTNLLDSLGERTMQKAQYRRVGSAESLWVTHTCRAVSGGATGSQWAQIDVTGGTVATTPVQQQKYDPADGDYRWNSSIAADKDGNMALGYSVSGASTFPSIAYSGRLATDPANNLPQSEVTLAAGAGSQVNDCGGGPCHRWGDYSSMSLAPDGCTFWFTSQYYVSADHGTTGSWDTSIGSFKFPSCTTITCPADFAVDRDPGSCGAVVEFTGVHAATATGTPAPTIVYSPLSGSAFPGGATSVTATATNTAGSASCTFTVTVHPAVCTALDACHLAGACDQATGACTNPNAPDGTSCDDGNPSTLNDVCTGGVCGSVDLCAGVTCTAQDQCHVAGTCDPATGACSNPNEADGTACNDSDACTQTDACQAGTCTGGNPVTCAAQDQCHVAGTCNPATGTCSNPNQADGTACNDANACTQTDTCQAGTCTGGNSVTCAAQDQCHVAGTCAPATGTCSNPNLADGTACDDGDPNTANDVCTGGVCGGTDLCAGVTCAAQDQCHVAGTCNPATGTCSNPNQADGTACSDGSLCTIGDACSNGSCQPGAPVNCDDSNECTDDACDPATGQCLHAPNSAVCDDNNPCTLNDTCANGTCAGTPDPAAPTALGNSVRVDRSPTNATVSWTDPSGPYTYNVYRGGRGSTGAWQYNQSSLAHQGRAVGGSVADTDIPPPAHLFYYLITRVGASGCESALGDASSGTERPNATPAPLPPRDDDGDLVPDYLDNCPAVANQDQLDDDQDGVGALCDNCASVSNSDQSDIDGDQLGDACDPDIDGDNVPNEVDNCPYVWNDDQADSNNNGIGDACDDASRRPTRKTAAQRVSDPPAGKLRDQLPS